MVRAELNGKILAGSYSNRRAMLIRWGAYGNTYYKHEGIKFPRVYLWLSCFHLWRVKNEDRAGRVANHIGSNAPDEKSFHVAHSPVSDKDEIVISIVGLYDYLFIRSACLYDEIKGYLRFFRIIH